MRHAFLADIGHARMVNNGGKGSQGSCKCLQASAVAKLQRWEKLELVSLEDLISWHLLDLEEEGECAPMHAKTNFPAWHVLGL